MLRLAFFLLVMTSAFSNCRDIHAVPPFTLSTQLVREGAPPEFHWIVPRATAISETELLMTLGKRGAVGTDIYLGLGFTTSGDGGKTWVPVTDLPYTTHPLREDITGMFG